VLDGDGLNGTRNAYLAHVTTIPSLIIDDLTTRKLRQTAAEDLLEIVANASQRSALLRNWPAQSLGLLFLGPWLLRGLGSLCLLGSVSLRAA
jgi:DNA replication protein DnaC